MVAGSWAVCGGGLPAVQELLGPHLLGPHLLGQAAEPLIKRLDGPTRVSVLAALVGLVILGLALILLTWMGARFVRRLGARPHAPPPSSPLDDWAAKPLAGPPTSDETDEADETDQTDEADGADETDESHG